MGELVTINFRSRAIRIDRALEAKVRDCLKAFDQTGTYDAALKLCRTACPGSEVGLAQALPDGRWIVEANNLQQSWRFDWEPPKAVLRDVRTIDWILKRLRSSAQTDPVAGRPVLGF